MGLNVVTFINCGLNLSAALKTKEFDVKIPEKIVKVLHKIGEDKSEPFHKLDYPKFTGTNSKR